MKAPEIDALVKPRDENQVSLHSLMPRRVHKILLVASLYDSFTFEEDGNIGEILFGEYLALNLRYAPRFSRACTFKEALEMLGKERFDLIISMPDVGELDIRSFVGQVEKLAPDTPVAILAHNTRLLQKLQTGAGGPKTYVWNGDHQLFTAIIKSTEDRFNIEHDVKAAGIQCIIMIEDSVRFYSAYLPMLYTELVKQTQALMTDGVNRMQKLLRMRARPKILHATTFEEGLAFYNAYKNHVLGVILDVSFPKDGELCNNAGIQFARMVRDDVEDRPILIQSSDIENREVAESLSCCFIDKSSPNLLSEVRGFITGHLGFGDFVFRRPDGSFVDRAWDLRSLAQKIRTVPDESIVYHAEQNHFSTWLMARTEFKPAMRFRPARVSDFSSVSELREYLIKSVMAYRKEKRAGLVEEFEKGDIVEPGMFLKIGGGSLGGKGRGLAFMNSLFNRYRIEDHFPRVRIFVPPTAILCTDVFDQFLGTGSLAALAMTSSDDEAIASAFLKAPLPEGVVESLRSFLRQVKYPLAVRSSSLLEDASAQPFAGVYSTYLIPNSDEDVELRLQELMNAIRLVYASTFFQDAKSYLDSTPNRLEEEKMAVVIQQVVGRRHGDHVYPSFSGAARSRNFYPIEGMAPTDGVACVALGLGHVVVDGGRCIRFSPKYPRRLYQFSSVKETLKTAQVEFSALDLTRKGPGPERPRDNKVCLVTLGLDVAEEDRTLGPVGSVYSRENDAIYDGISRPGYRLVTMAGVLKNNIFPLGEVLDFILNLGKAAFSGPVEMEFAVNLGKSGEPHEFGFLQIRPQGTGGDLSELDLTSVTRNDAVCMTDRALGHGLLKDIQDIVYVRPRSFDRSQTAKVADEVGQMNKYLKTDNRNCVLIGPGRWGSSDHWLGIPVSWSQVSNTGCFVETDMEDIRVEPSQGTHFFQNITSLGIGYFTVNFGAGTGFLDYDWLDSLPAERESRFVRMLHFEQPIRVVVDSRTGRGVIFKPGPGKPSP